MCLAVESRGLIECTDRKCVSSERSPSVFLGFRTSKFSSRTCAFASAQAYRSRAVSETLHQKGTATIGAAVVMAGRQRQRPIGRAAHNRPDTALRAAFHDLPALTSAASRRAAPFGKKLVVAISPFGIGTKPRMMPRGSIWRMPPSRKAEAYKLPLTS
jgi:hypothetical protein